MAKPKGSKVRVNFRSAVTGKYVKQGYAKRYPHLTVKETDKKK